MYTMIADSNALRHPGLKGYFMASRNHAIALSDLTILEMQKKNALTTSRMSTAILNQFSDRVFVLRRTDMILDLRVSDRTQMAGLFDYEGTLAFRKLCAALQSVPVPAGLIEEMDVAEKQAEILAQRLQDEVSEWEAALVDACTDFTPSELTEIRTGKDVSEGTRAKVFDLLKITVASFMRDNLGITKGRIPLRDLRDTFAFRYPLAVSMYYLRWVRDGRTTGKRIERRMNDVIDLQVATLSTFLHGILSRDGLTATVSSASRRMLRENFNAYVPEDWPPASR